MSTKDTLTNLGLLVAGGAAIAMASRKRGPQGSSARSHGQGVWTGLKINLSNDATDGDTASMVYGPLIGLNVSIYTVNGQVQDAHVLGFGRQSPHKSDLMRLEFKNIDQDGEPKGSVKSLAFDLIESITVY